VTVLNRSELKFRHVLGSDQMVTECCILSLAASSTVDPDLLEETSIQQNTAIQSFQETLVRVLS
jgi:predicted nucleic acid-binding protein